MNYNKLINNFLSRIPRIIVCGNTDDNIPKIVVADSQPKSKAVKCPKIKTPDFEETPITCNLNKPPCEMLQEIPPKKRTCCSSRKSKTECCKENSDSSCDEKYVLCGKNLMIFQ